MDQNKKRIVYFSHGGGPLPLLGDPGHKAMIDFMRVLPQQIARPDLILVISAHWEEKLPTLLGAEHPGMFYDYYGFPEAAYQIQYPCPGSPALATEAQALLNAQGIPAAINPTRGIDHGHFIPLSLMYPQAENAGLLLDSLDPASVKYTLTAKPVTA